MHPRILNLTINRPVYYPEQCLKSAFSIGVFVLIGACLFVQQSQAAADSPRIVVEKVFEELAVEFRSFDTTPSARQIEVLFAEKLSPHIDYPGLARWTLREHWTNSEELQRSAFLVALQKHLLKTYAAALAFDKSTSLNLDQDIKSGKRLTQVSGTVSTASSSNTDILFRLVGNDGRWQIFDVGVHGISVAKTLRADIAAIAGHGGIDAVTAALTTGDFRLISQR